MSKYNLFAHKAGFQFVKPMRSNKYDTGKTISGLSAAAKLDGVEIFHAGTKRANGEIVTAGGRVLAVAALGSTIEVARARAYEAVSRIHFENCHYRRDIALSVGYG